MTTRARIVVAASVLLGMLSAGGPLVGPAEARGMRERFARSWQELSPDEQQRARENFQRYRSLPESSRQRMDRSYESWQQLDKGERDRVERNYQKYREMTPDQRRNFEQKYKRWKGGKDR